MKHSPKMYLQFIFFALLFTFASFIISSAALEYASVYFMEESLPAAADAPVPFLMIDPGHGGEDGGASSGDTLEKDLNLLIAEHILDLCTVFGYDARMTRTDDRLLYDAYDDLEDYTGQKKTYDLRNRLRLAEESQVSLYLGIHINKFFDPKYKGLQVYYSPNTDESRQAAERIQKSARQFLDPDNEREIKSATKAIYILNRIKIPAVLVECGFLSNPEELALLETASYRIKLASSIFSSAAEYLTSYS